jgi:hypothetical protein
MKYRIAVVLMPETGYSVAISVREHAFLELSTYEDSQAEIARLIDKGDIAYPGRYIVSITTVESVWVHEFNVGQGGLTIL